MTTPLKRLPRLVEGLDVKGLPIDPQEAFVLSFVDGTISAAEIATSAGIEARVVERMLDKLVSLGAVRFEEISTPPRSKPRFSPPPAPLKPMIEQITASARPPDSPSPGSEVDLDPGRQREILELHGRLDTLTHYQLLQVEPSADKREIKSRYYQVVNSFHPDRYFGKRLGSFKPMLERIFQRITEAHDVLTRSLAREEYDAYLKTNARMQALDPSLFDPEAHQREVLDLARRIEAEASSAASARPPRGPAPEPQPSAPPEGAGSAPPVSSGSMTPRPVRRSSDPDARRRALARKLGVSMVPAAPKPTEATKQEQRAQFEQRIREAKQQKIAEYVRRADAAQAAGNLADAIKALRVATSLAPKDAVLSSRLSGLETHGVRELSEGYLNKARYEEREGRFREAAASYARALAAAPGARVSERLAHCLLEAGVDIKKAVEQARQAVLTEPGEPGFRVTLARAYAEARMAQSAQAELARAERLAPGDAELKASIAKIKQKLR